MFVMSWERELPKLDSPSDAVVVVMQRHAARRLAVNRNMLLCSMVSFWKMEWEIESVLVYIITWHWIVNKALFIPVITDRDRLWRVSIYTCFSCARLIMYMVYWCHIVSLVFVNIGSGNGLLPDGTKPLPGPMLNYHQRCCEAFSLLWYRAVPLCMHFICVWPISQYWPKKSQWNVYIYIYMEKFHQKCSWTCVFLDFKIATISPRGRWAKIQITDNSSMQTENIQQEKWYAGHKECPACIWRTSKTPHYSHFVQRTLNNETNLDCTFSASAR